MKKSLFSLLFVSLLTLLVSASPVSASSSSNEVDKGYTSFRSVFYIKRNKTIRHYYGTVSAIPTTFDYKENVEGKWYRGTLTLTSTTRTDNGGWYATYSGQLVTAIH